MAGESATFAYNLDTSGMVAGANQGAGALEKLQDSLAADTEEVKTLQQALRMLRGATGANAATIDEMNRRLKAAKNNMALTASQIVKMNGSLTKQKKASVDMKELAGVASRAGGPLGNFAGLISRTSGLLGKSGLAGIAIVAAAAIAAIPAAVLAATGALSRLALGYADARREERIMLEGMTRMRYWWGYIPGKASDVQAAIDNVSNSTALARDKIGDYAQQLYRAGLRGANFSDALEAVSIKASVQGDAAAQAFMGWAMGAQFLGTNIRAMAKDVKARLGDLAEMQNIGFGTQIRKLKENMGQLFATVRIDGFLRAMHKVTSLFSTSTVAGRGLQTAIGNIFNVIFGGGKNAGDTMKMVTKGMILGILKFSNFLLLLKIRWLQVRKEFSWLFPDKGKNLMMGFKAAELVERGLKGIMFAAIGCTGAILLFGATISAVVLALPMGIWNAVKAVGELAKSFWGMVTSIGTPLTNIFKLVDLIAVSFRKNFSKGGKAIVQGIIDGITGDLEAAKNAVMGMGDKLKSWFKKSLGIQSPSKVFRLESRNIPRGMALGIEDEQTVARQAVAGMADPSAIRGRIGSLTTNNQGPRISVDVGGIHVSASNSEQLKEGLEEAVAAIFERLAAQLASA